MDLATAVLATLIGGFFIWGFGVQFLPKHGPHGLASFLLFTMVVGICTMVLAFSFIPHTA